MSTTAQGWPAADLTPVMPRPSGSHYIHRTPPWLVICLRLACAAFAGAIAVLSAHEWATMPIPAKMLIAVLIPGLAYCALSRRVWRGTVKFMADARGIHFPHNSLLVRTIGEPRRSEWLLVPWHKIANIRVSEVPTEDGSALGLCLDVQVTKSQADDFLAHVALPQDKRAAMPGWVTVGYADRPPHPAKTVARLSALKPVRA